MTPRQVTVIMLITMFTYSIKTLRQVTVMMLITMFTWYNDNQTGDSDYFDYYVHIV